MRLAAAGLLLAACHGATAAPDAPTPDASTFHVSDLVGTMTMTETETAFSAIGYFYFPDGSFAKDARVTVTIGGVAMDATELLATPYAPSVRSHFEVSTAPTVSEGDIVEMSVALGDEVATSTVTMPPPFTIDQVTGSLSAPPITVTWSPTRSDPMQWVYAALSDARGHMCTATAQIQQPPSVPDTGSLTLDGTFSVQGIGCGRQLSLERRRTGMPAANLAPSSITAIQSRIVATE